MINQLISNVKEQGEQLGFHVEFKRNGSHSKQFAPAFDLFKDGEETGIRFDTSVFVDKSIHQLELAVASALVGELNKFECTVPITFDI
jgi:hypothetical protein